MARRCLARSPVVDADLAVLDWNLANMPGIKLLAELRQHCVNLPVVFLTGKVIAGDDKNQCVLVPRRVWTPANAWRSTMVQSISFPSHVSRQVLVRRLRNVIELDNRAKAKTDVPLQDGLVCDKSRAEAGNQPRLL